MSIRDNLDISAYLVLGPENTLGRPVGDVVAQALDAGFTCIQVRSKVASAREIIALTGDAAQAIAQAGKTGQVALLIDDRLDCVLAARELLQHLRRHRFAPMRQHVAGLQRGHHRMAEFFAGGGLVAACHLRRVVQRVVGGWAFSHRRRVSQRPSGIMPACRTKRCRKRMRVLVSNDDGVDAPGIQALAKGLRGAGHEVLVVAPDRDRSGASNSLTLDAPIRVLRLDAWTWKVYGTPTDCVHVAITGMLDAMGLAPDIVVSGINNTANLGDDVIYSGTVAAAMEGRFLGLPAVAVSLDTRNHDARHYETAARAAVEIVARLKADPLPANTILNVNVPDLAWSEVRGFEVTRLGNRHRAEHCVAQDDPRGRTVYWVGPVGPEQDAGNGTDFHAIRQQRVSITPLMIDLTARDQLDVIQTWLNP